MDKTLYIIARLQAKLSLKQMGKWANGQMGRWANLQMVIRQFPVPAVIGQLTKNIEKQVF
jgi:hypothetical protein